MDFQASPRGGAEADFEAPMHFIRKYGHSCFLFLFFMNFWKMYPVVELDWS